MKIEVIANRNRECDFLGKGHVVLLIVVNSICRYRANRKKTLLQCDKLVLLMNQSTPVKKNSILDCI
jgi:hypothetical protein